MLVQYLVDPPTVIERLTFGADAKGNNKIVLVTNESFITRNRTIETSDSQSTS